MKIGIIDIGTNTFHLLLADTVVKNNPVFFKTQSPVKLGENILLENKIIPAAYERGINCLKAFKTILDEHQINFCYAVATAGVRTAQNGLEFISDVKRATQIDIEIIDGDAEAQLIYEGVKWSDAIKGPSLIMDIGGGSTEFIICDTNNFYWKKSYPIGASKLMQRFFKSDPINPTDKSNLIHYLKDTLADLFAEAKKLNLQKLIGSAGAFESFAALTDLNTVDHYEKIDLNRFKLLAKQLEESSHQERMQIKNLIPLRVDMIVMASILTELVIDEIQIKDLFISAYDLKMGLLKTKM